MSFVSPIWLLALLPWAAVTVWLMWGRRKRVYVPFLDLWKGPAAKPIEKSAIEPPPFWLACAMVAMLLAAIAAAKPRISAGRMGKMPISIVIDRGITMSARGSSEERYRELAHQAAGSLLEAFGAGPADVFSVPGTEPIHADRSDWLGRTVPPPTAVDTGPLLRPLLLNLLRQDKGPIVVLSDQELHIDDPRVVQITPQTSVANVGIVRLAARETPSSQLMVCVRNQSPQRRARLLISAYEPGAAPAPVALDIDLPAEGERNYFLPLPAIVGAALARDGAAAGGTDPMLAQPVISVQLQVDDDLPADNRAFLVRERSWPTVEARASLPPELGRMIELYGRLRPARTSSKRVAIVTTMADLPASEPAVIAASSSPTASPAALSAIGVVEHPVTKAVGDWTSLKLQPGANLDVSWKPIVTAGGQTLVAVRNEPAREVWVGMGSETAASSPDFVIFWTNVFNWLGEGAESFASYPVGQLGPGWTRIEPASADGGGLMPGLYRRSDGLLRAVNALDVHVPVPFKTPWREQLARLAADPSITPRGRDLTPMVLLLALAAVLLASLTYRRPPQRRPLPEE